MPSSVTRSPWSVRRSGFGCSSAFFLLGSSSSSSSSPSIWVATSTFAWLHDALGESTVRSAWGERPISNGRFAGTATVRPASRPPDIRAAQPRTCCGVSSGERATRVPSSSSRSVSRALAVCSESSTQSASSPGIVVPQTASTRSASVAVSAYCDVSTSWRTPSSSIASRTRRLSFFLRVRVASLGQAVGDSNQ